MQAVILAAGQGTRLGDLTKDRPKALVRVCGRELILWALEFLDHPVITERIVVTGYEAGGLDSFIKEHRPGVKIVHNPYFMDGNIRSIEAALPHLKGDLLLMNVDHIYPGCLMERITKHRGLLSIVCDFDRTLGPDDMKVKLSADGKLAKISKDLKGFDGGYIGMTLVPAELIPNYCRAVTTARQKEGNSAAVERAIGLAATEGLAVHICDASGIEWFEVDTADDLRHAEACLKDNRSFAL